MTINANKPHLWQGDIEASVDLFNLWFISFAPQAYRDARKDATKNVEAGLRVTHDLRSITPNVLMSNPEVLPTLRMSTCPPLARDRLIGLASANKNLVLVMEEGSLPAQMSAMELQTNLDRITRTITRMLDTDIFPWLAKGSAPGNEEKRRASIIVADRLCGAVSDPRIRNAQEERQLALIKTHLESKNYRQKAHPTDRPITEMEPGTFAFRRNILVGDVYKVNVPVDAVVQPRKPRPDGVPILIEAKSAGDFTNVNKRRKEEAMKVGQLRATYGRDIAYLLFLCGYFDSGYLKYEAAEGIDWVWEHRIEDMDQLGL